jgi:hypothetical protein
MASGIAVDVEGFRGWKDGGTVKRAGVRGKRVPHASGMVGSVGQTLLTSTMVCVGKHCWARIRFIEKQASLRV